MGDLEAARAQELLDWCQHANHEAIRLCRMLMILLDLLEDRGLHVSVDELRRLLVVDPAHGLPEFDLDGEFDALDLAAALVRSALHRHSRTVEPPRGKLPDYPPSDLGD